MATHRFKTFCLTGACRPALWIWAVASLLLAGMLMITAYLTYQKELSRTSTLVVENSHTYATLTHYLLADMERLAERLVDDPFLHLLQRQEAMAIALLRHRKQTMPHVMEILLIDGEGQLLAWSGDGEKPDPSECAYFTAMITPTEHLSRISTPARSQLFDQRWYVSLSTGNYDETGQLQRAVAILVDLERLNHLYLAAMSNPDMSFTLMHQQGPLLMRHPILNFAPGDLPPRPDQLTLPLNEHRLIRSHTTLDGRDRLASYQPIEPYELIAVSSADMQIALHAWKLNLQVMAVVWVVTTLSGLLVALKIASQINESRRRKELEARLEASENRFQVIVENANDLIYTLNAKGIITYISPNSLDMLGLAPDQVIGNPVAQFVHEDDLPACMAFIRKLFSSGTKQAGIEYRVRHHSGEWRWHTSNAAPLYNPQQRVESFLGISRDITQRKEQEEQLRHLALHDTLTGLPNRGFFYELAEQSLILAQRNLCSAALMFVDLDGFKPVNDQLGHAVGDQLLQQVATRLRRCLRSSDLVGRLGGDEFIILLQEADSGRHAIQVAEKVRNSLSQPFTIEDSQVSISACIGVSVYPQDGEALQTLISHADSAMYEAKAQGRNRCVRFDPGTRPD